MKKQRGLTLISTLIVGIFLVAALLLGLKLVPVFNEYFGAKKALNTIVQQTDPTSPPAAFRNAFSKQADIDDFTNIDPQALVVTKSNGKVGLSVDYERRVPLFANVSLVFEFSLSAGAADTSGNQ